MTIRSNVLIGIFAVAGSTLAISAGCNPTDATDEGVTALNPSTGEVREFEDAESVPDGWVQCDDGGCPEPDACGTLDESACLVREDCAPIYEATGSFSFCVDGGEETCPVEACGPPILGLPNQICFDGTVGGPTGRCLDQEGVCGWEVINCPEPPACDEQACGPAPGAPNFECPDGTVGGPSCGPNSEGECVWGMVECADPDGLCDDPIKCGPALGMPSWVCEDGTIGGNTGNCLDLGDETCGWEVVECP